MTVPDAETRLSGPGVEQPADVDREAQPGGARSVLGLRALPAVVLVLGAVVPLVRTVGFIRGSSRLQYTDYWLMIDGMLAGDGTLRIAGFFEFRNEHPIFLPRIAYWLNVELFGGDNRALAVFVLAAALGQVVVIAVLARGTASYGTWSRVSVVVTATALVLSPLGAWSFVRAMSGTAWIVANLLVTGALLAFQRDRRFLAPGLAVAATLSYGTGLAAWPALLVAGVVRDRRAVLRNWPTALAAAASVLWYLRWFRGYDNPIEVDRNPLVTIQRVVERIGWPVAGDGLALVLGIACLAVLVAAGASVLRDRTVSTEAAPWFGLGVFGLVSCALIVNARPDVFLTGAMSSRYASLGAATVIAAVALVLLVGPRHWGWSLLPLPLVLAVWFATPPDLPSMQWNRDQDLLAVAMWVDLADGNRVTTPFEPFPRVTDRLRRAAHHPFDGGFDLDCGDLGAEVATTDELGEAASAQLASADPRAIGGVSFEGRIEIDEPVACVVVIDEHDVVVGAGTTWIEDDGTLGFETLAPEGADLRVAFRAADDPAYRVLDPAVDRGP